MSMFGLYIQFNLCALW